MLGVCCYLRLCIGWNMHIFWDVQTLLKQIIGKNKLMLWRSVGSNSVKKTYIRCVMIGWEEFDRE